MLLVLGMVSGSSVLAIANDGKGLNIIRVEYSDFINNKVYYSQLVNDGYTLIINVGEENAEKEQARIDALAAQADNGIDTLKPNLERGANIPNSTWNIAKKGMYSFRGEASHGSSTYTANQFYGVTSYNISVYNAVSGELTVQVFDAVDDDYADFSFTVKSGETVITGLSNKKTSDRFYLCFLGYANFSGYVEEK